MDDSQRPTGREKDAVYNPATIFKSPGFFLIEGHLVFI